MLSLLNKGYYISPSKVEPKKTFVDPYKQEQLKNIIQSGKYINRYHFDCIFRGSGINNPFPNRRSGGSSRGASVLQSFSQHQYSNSKHSLSLNYSLQQDILSTPQKTETNRQNIPQASPEGQYFEYEEEEEDYSQQVPQSGSLQNYYDQPMALKTPMVSEAKEFLEQDSDERRRDNRLDYPEAGGPKVKYNGSSRLHNSVASGFSAGSVHHEDVNKMSPIRREFEIAREYNNAASVIQRAWRGYLENKRGQRWSTQQAQQSNYISFGGERGDSDYIGTSESENLVETVRNQSERVIQDSSYNHREQHSRHYYPPELPITEEESAGSGGYRYTTDGSEVYDQAMERLSTLRSLIERDYPRMKGIQKRIEDVKYYFDLGQNLIDEYTRHEPFSSEIYDLILAYNETFRNAHNELDQISSELTNELSHLGERTSVDYQREPRGYGRDGPGYSKPYERERNRYESRKTSGLEIVRELWGYMRDMSENLLACQDQHRQTDNRVKKLERENFSYKNLYMNFKEKEKLRESQREFEENIRMTDPQPTEVETERNAQPDYMGNTKSSDRDSDIDRQLEAEMLRSQGLKKDLINVLETYDQVSVQRKARNSAGRNSSYSSLKNSGLKKPTTDQGYQKPRESRDSREYSYQNDRPAESRHSFGPGNPPRNYQGSRNEMMEYYESERPQEDWRDVHNNELHNVMNYYNDGNNSMKSREIYIEEAPEMYQPSPSRQEYVIKRPSRSSLQDKGSQQQSMNNFPAEPQYDSSRLQRVNQIEDPSNIKTSPRFGEDQMPAHHQAVAMKKWPNINQMKRELEASLDREDIIEVSSEGRYYKPVKPNLSWKKTP